MKKKLPALLAWLLLSATLFGQYNLMSAPGDLTYTQVADSIFSPISKSQVTTGILYDRVAPFAGLHAFKSTDTSSYLHFFLAYSELYSAAYNNGTMMKAAQIDTLSNAMYYTNNVIPVGVLYYDFNLIDTLAIANNLLYQGSDSLLHDVTGRTGNPFKLKTITVAAALSQDTLDYGTGNITFKYINQLFLTNKGVTISSIYADFGSGNQNLSSGNNVTVFYPTSGKKTIKFTITYSNAQTATVYSKIFLSSPPVSGRFGEAIDPDVAIDIDDLYGYQGYGETSKKYNRGKYGIYYHKTYPGGPKEMILKKPIIILDGFDPQESRDIAKLYGIYLQYTSSANFGKEMLDLGYDVIVLNFPNKTETKTIYSPGIGSLQYKTTRAQGADFIQRNAFLLVTLLKKINQQLAANGSTEKLVVIGPSMGGLISRYALRWMELNGENHNTRLWISFDAPHKGANIPIGDQYFIDFYASKLNSESAKDAKDNSLNSPAARQMLLHHFTANSTTPAGAPNFRNSWQTELDNLGYPQNLRKIALINGAINGTTQGTACQNVYKLGVNIHAPNMFLFFVQIIKVTEGNIWFAGNNGNTCEVFKGWSKVPFLSNSKSAAAPSSSKSYDIIPGGYYDAQAQLGGSNLQFNFLFGKLYKPSVVPTTGYFGMWTQTNAQILNPNHCFIPTFSALGMNITNKDLSENLYNRDLTCTGETPFQAYYAPQVNQEHITLTTENVAWITKEIEGMPQSSSVNWPVVHPITITSGIEPVCGTGGTTYTVNNVPPGSTVQWVVTPSSPVTTVITGSSIKLTRVSNATVTLTAKISGCSYKEISRQVVVGPPPSSSVYADWDNPLKIIAGADPVTGATSYKWYVNNVFIKSTSTPNTSLSYNGNCTTSVTVGVEVVTSCGTSGKTNTNIGTAPCDNYYIITPNPAQDVITISADEQSGMAAKAGVSSSSTNSIEQIKIFNSNGIVLKSVQHTEAVKQVQVNVANLAPGLYFIEVSNGIHKRTKRLVITR